MKEHQPFVIRGRVDFIPGYGLDSVPVRGLTVSHMRCVVITESSSSSKTGVIVGSVIGSLVFVIIVIAVIVYFLKKKSSKVEPEGKDEGNFETVRKSTVTVSHGSHAGDQEAPTDVGGPSTPRGDGATTPVKRLA